MARKSLTLLLSVLMMLSLVLAACSGGQSNEPAPNNSSNQGGNNQQTNTNTGSNNDQKKEPEPPVEFTVMLPLNTADQPTDVILKEVEKLTNTKLTYNFFPADTYEEKLSASFATGSLPEVVYMKNQATFIQMKEAIRDGQFWEIGPYLDEFENLKKLKEPILKNTMVDGKLYSLYIGRPLARQGMIYRKDWADNLGLSAPKNVDEFYEMLRAFTYDDPDGDGVNNTIGLTDRNDLVYGAFDTVASWFGVPTNWGFKDGELRPKFMFDEYIEVMDFFKKIRDNGLMNQDFATTSKTDQVNLLTSGKAGVYVGSMQDINSLHKDTQANNPNAELSVHALIEGPGGKLSTWAIPGYNNVVLFYKGAIKDENKLRKILAYFDKMMTPEVSNLMYWGIEGVHYEVVDGKAKASSDSDLINRDVKGYKDSVIGESETNGSLPPYIDLPARQLAEELILENEKIAIHDPTAALDSATYNEKGLQLDEIWKNATYQYIYGQIDKAGFQAAIDDWLKRGGEDVIREFNEAYKAAQ
jgi:putative aldouronate transport system substrate-binding protein